jgi:N-acetylglutamate synthase-like GNAT family acetyltransferase
MTTRRARAADQKTITRIVRESQIYPFGLEWKRFVVVEENGEIIGVGQVKRHDDGTHELASIAVTPERRRKGIGSEIIRVLLSEENGSVYLMCRDELDSYYSRFGFRRQSIQEMSVHFRRMHRIANLYLFRTVGSKIIVMKRDPES